jgi:Predicted signal-transduction protein containing cAMP-binding and CBS domains
MSTELVVVSPTATIAETATVIGARGVGSALVMDGSVLLGVFTERDVVRAVAQHFDGSEHQVHLWMTREPMTIGPDASTAEALDTMLEQGFRHLPVVEGGTIVGMVSMRDLQPGPARRHSAERHG